MFNLRRLFTPRSEHIAAVDLGSNSFHLIIARWEGGQLTLLDRLREPVGLGWGLETDGRLEPSVRDRALACLERFGERLRDFPSGNVRAVGTKTLRSIQQAEEFLQAAQERLGHPVEIISGDEEARLIYQGVAHCIAPDEQPRLVIDIGGGSTEVILGEGMEAQLKASLNMGCVALTKRFFPHGKVTGEQIQKALIAARQEVTPLVDEYTERNWAQVLGASGTIKTAASICLAEGWSQGDISADSLQLMIDTYRRRGSMDVLFAGMSPDRQLVFLGGLIVLAALFEALNIHTLQAADWALREGLLYDLKGRLENHDARETSIQALAVRFHVNMAKAERVAETARVLLLQVCDAWNLNTEEAQKILRWAAFLYPVGLDISHSDYHKHSAYIIEHVDIAGCSRIEQTQLALLARAHRKSLGSKMFAATDTDILHLALILRLAILFNRTRKNALPEHLQIQASNAQVTLVMSRAWLQDNPLTQADLETEAEHWQALDYRLSIVDN